MLARPSLSGKPQFLVVVLKTLTLLARNNQTYKTLLVESKTKHTPWFYQSCYDGLQRCNFEHLWISSDHIVSLSLTIMWKGKFYFCVASGAPELWAGSSVIWRASPQKQGGWTLSNFKSDVHGLNCSSTYHFTSGILWDRFSYSWNRYSRVSLVQALRHVLWNTDSWASALRISSKSFCQDVFG